MKEIKILGRGGQGVVSASAVLATAFFKQGFNSQAFPMYGIERRGGPATAFVRVDKKEILRHDQVYSPFVLIVIDESLLKTEMEDVLKSVGLLLVNTKKSPEEIRNQFDKFNKACMIKTIDANKIALEELKKPFANIPLIGAFAGASKLVSIEALNQAIEEIWADKGQKIIEANQAAVKKSYDLLKCDTCKVEV